jgi:hypothetical protein
MILSLIIWVIIGAITANLAKQRGRDPYVWFLVGMVLGLFGILALFILPKAKRSDVPNPHVVIPTVIVPEVVVEPIQLFHCKDWFCVDVSKKQLGPMNFTDFKKLWDEKKILPQSYVWTEGMASWLPLSNVPDLESALNKT